jgi:uncharacterized membrane protein
MESLLVLIAIAYLIAPIAAFFLAIGARNRIDELAVRLAKMERQLAATQRSLGTAPIPAPPQAEARPAERIELETPGPTPATAAIAEPEPVPPPKPTSVPTAAKSTTTTARTKSFEENFGTRWVVWIGGLALALGGYFLVRFSIEQGLLGPGVRVFLGALLAGILISLGEWTRRQEKLSDLIPFSSANIPSILTAAGTAVAFATVYAAYALYGFLGTGSAFILLGIVALATLAAALLHGPALAALGFIGAEITPLLVASDQPNYWALYTYLAVVTAAVFVLARVRLWRWLAITGAVFGLLWMLPGIADGRSGAVPAHVFHGFAGFALAALLIVSGFVFGPEAKPGRIDGVSSGALIACLIGPAFLVIGSGHDSLTIIAFVILAASTVTVAWNTEAAVAAVPAGAALSALVLAHWALDRTIAQLVAPAGLTAGAVAEPLRTDAGTHLALGAILAAVFGVPGFLAQGRSSRAVAPILWAASGVAAPLAILIALYYRIAGFERSIPFAGLALLLAAFCAVATETLGKRPTRPGLVAAGAIYATGTVVALALTFTFALEKGWLTIALALTVPGIAWVANQRPLKFLRFLAAVMVVLVLLRIGYEPRIVGSDVGTTPIFNWLLYGYGMPAAAFWYGGYLLHRRVDDLPARMVESAAILFTVLLAFLEVRHFMNHGDIYSSDGGLAELALQVSVGLAMCLGLEWVRGRTKNIVHNVGAIVIAALTLAGIVFGLWLIENPMITHQPVGGVFFNLILLGYGVPAVLAILLALTARTTRPLPYRSAAAITAVALALLYLTFEVARLFQGPLLAFGPTSDAEQYTYSAIWLAFGVVLLVVGIFLQSEPARLASAAVTLLTVAKVFLLDMDALTGVWRALSFIGLGGVLVGIGLLYQRLLFPARART